MKVMLDDSAVKPARAHDLDAGLDLCAREDAYIRANNSYVFDTGVHVEIPKNCVGFIKSRSGLMVNHGILTDGTIDCGYTGPIKVKLFNLSRSRYEVRKGDKIAQLVILPCILAPVELVDKLESTERDEAARIALQVACVALNDTEGLGYTRLSRFAKRLQVLISEYYEDPEVGDVHLEQRLTQLGFLIKDGRMYCVENAAGEIFPTKKLEEQGKV